MSASIATEVETGLRGRTLLLAGVLLVAINLRAAIASVSPILSEIAASLPLSQVGARWLTTIPVLCFGVASALAPWLARRWGGERAIGAMMVLLALGMVLRITGSGVALFFGTIVGTSAIGITNVLLPALFKREFPHHIGLVTGLYTMVMAIGAAAAAGFTVPLERWLDGDWRIGLGVWALLPLPALCLWLPQLRTRTEIGARAAPRGLRRNALAWAVTGFMGLQSAMFYAVLSWLPEILQQRGMTRIDSGFVLSLSVMMQIAASLVVPVLAGRRPGQRPLAVALVLMTLVGFLGCLYGPLILVWPASALLGIGQGGLFGLALMLIVLRSPDVAVASSLSGMSQSVGYCLASLGPFAAGAVHDWSGSWDGTALLFTAAALVTLALGWRAAAPRLIQL